VLTKVMVHLPYNDPECECVRRLVNRGSLDIFLPSCPLGSPSVPLWMTMSFAAGASVVLVRPSSIGVLRGGQRRSASSNMRRACSPRRGPYWSWGSSAYVKLITDEIVPRPVSVSKELNQGPPLDPCVMAQRIPLAVVSPVSGVVVPEQ